MATDCGAAGIRATNRCPKRQNHGRPPMARAWQNVTLSTDRNCCGIRRCDSTAASARFSMMNPTFRRALACAAFTFAAAQAADADAARVGVLSNKYFAETAADFNANVGGHTFTGIDVSAATPTLAVTYRELRRPAAVRGRHVCERAERRKRGCGVRGDRPASRAGRRSTTRIAATARATTIPHGWGTLETIDPNTTDGIATPLRPSFGYGCARSTRRPLLRIPSPPASRRSPAPIRRR